MTGSFIIKPQKTQMPRVYDDTFLWEEKGIYVMANHRLALWCWLQCDDVFKKEHAFIHIDRHTDARQWEASSEPECLERALSLSGALKNLKVYNDLQCHFENYAGINRKERPCITYDNFVHLAAKLNLFNYYYIYSSQGDWPIFLPEINRDFYKEISDIQNNLSASIEKHAKKCIVDVDLDFFDSDGNVIFPDGVSEDDLLLEVLEIIAKNKENISMITISLNEIPGDSLWGKRQHQLSIIKEVFEMNVSVPIITL